MRSTCERTPPGTTSRRPVSFRELRGKGPRALVASSSGTVLARTKSLTRVWYSEGRDVLLRMECMSVSLTKDPSPCPRSSVRVMAACV
jgi:hypothetical protein